jgi:hypothetical protein
VQEQRFPQTQKKLDALIERIHQKFLAKIADPALRLRVAVALSAAGNTF